jgi:hypothetical protein
MSIVIEPEYSIECLPVLTEKKKKRKKKSEKKRN